MEETEDDVMMKRARIGRMPNGQRGGPLHSTTVILRCERKRASKDERPVACGGLQAVALPITGLPEDRTLSAQVGNSRLAMALASLGHLRVTVIMECARHDTMRHDTMKCSETPANPRSAA
jgi:hypothetical protein